MKENKQPILSICIPTWNRWYSLQYTLKSIIDQDEFKSWEVEIVISDNASTDDTEGNVKNYAKRYKNIKYYRNNENIWLVPNINRSYTLWSWKYIRSLSSHVKLAENSLKKILSSIKLLKSDIILVPFMSWFNIKKTDNFYEKYNLSYYKAKKEFFNYIWEQYKYDYNSFYCMEHFFTNISCLIINKNYYELQKKTLIKRDWLTFFNSYNFIFYLIAYYNSKDANIIVHYNSVLIYLGDLEEFKKEEKRTWRNRLNPIYKKHANELIKYVYRNYNNSNEFIKFKQKFKWFWLYIFLSPILPKSALNFIIEHFKNVIKNILQIK